MKNEGKRGVVWFLALVLNSVLGREVTSLASDGGGGSYHRILQNAVGGWGDGSGAEFPFLCEQSERRECFLW